MSDKNKLNNQLTKHARLKIFTELFSNIAFLEYSEKEERNKKNQLESIKYSVDNCDLADLIKLTDLCRLHFSVLGRSQEDYMKINIIIS